MDAEWRVIPMGPSKAAAYQKVAAAAGLADAVRLGKSSVQDGMTWQPIEVNEAAINLPELDRQAAESLQH